ncbi:MAG: Druantia anti-phage system protein DruA [Candidatus Brocadia sp.]
MVTYPMRICGKEITDEDICRIRDIIAENWQKSRTQLSRQICEYLQWRGTNGRLKDASCRVVLLRFHRKGIIQLPEGKSVRVLEFKKSRDNKEKAVSNGVECELSELGEIRIIKIHSRYSKPYRVWKELMDENHYLGSGPLCGYQMKYLIESDRYGYIGGFAFSSAAWRLESRDKWIRWDEKRRQENLSKVACNSRFLIVPWVRVKNLASHVMSVCIRRLKEDWYEQYKIRPVLLETFVEQGRFSGSCYRASNWVHIGSTKGRGRQDSCNEYGESIKDIYMYPLDEDFREELCKGTPEKVVGREELVDWAEEEFSGAELGDRRLVDRLITIGHDFYARPQANIPQACGNRAKTKEAYRFLKNKSTTMEKIQKSRYEATVNRIGKEKIVLAVQDTTTLNYSTHPATADLGLIGTKVGGFVRLIVHDTMTFNVEGTPLGVIDVQCWARDPADFGKKHLRHKQSIGVP